MLFKVNEAILKLAELQNGFGTFFIRRNFGSDIYRDLGQEI